MGTKDHAPSFSTCTPNTVSEPLGTYSIQTRRSPISLPKSFPIVKARTGKDDLAKPSVSLWVVRVPCLRLAFCANSLIHWSESSHGRHLCSCPMTRCGSLKSPSMALASLRSRKGTGQTGFSWPPGCLKSLESTCSWTHSLEYLYVVFPSLSFLCSVHWYIQTTARSLILFAGAVTLKLLRTRQSVVELVPWTHTKSRRFDELAADDTSLTRLFAKRRSWSTRTAWPSLRQSIMIDITKQRAPATISVSVLANDLLCVCVSPVSKKCSAAGSATLSPGFPTSELFRISLTGTPLL
mmetsp:Transcript_112794/g.224366  ORF Transcript_112794/g.224366 Transcript_112794/m.224366 type:complete len:295 (+) Transcript_112794:737-1621(+)